ncbi:MAG: sigma-70 family RNA polymerase sigma factor [Clostridiaceae bacterium]
MLTENVVNNIKNQGFPPIYNFVQDNKDSLYKIAWAYLQNPYDIEDVFHNTIILVYENIGKLNKIEYFKTWFTSILINECKKLLRKNKKVLPTPISIGRNINLTLSESEIDLQISLNKLDSIYKEPIILKYYAGYTQEEIALALNLPIGTVKTRIYRGIKLLQKYMVKGV